MTPLKRLSMLILSLFLGIGGVNAQNVTIPDANFKAYLVGNTAINTNGDTEIQVAEATAFNGTIDCNNLGITDLTGVEAFSSLDGLNCSQNPITSLTLNQSTLHSLDCSNTSLTSLDVIGTYDMSTFKCSNTPLSALDFRYRDNTMIWIFEANNVPNLTCIEVDDVAFSTAYWTNIDATISYSASCAGPSVVNIPDAGFRNAVLSNSAINTNGDIYIQVTEAVAFTGAINCANSGVEDLTGIEAFVNLTGLNCSSNPYLYGIDLSQNVNLITLTSSGCVQLEWMNISQCVLLESLNADGCDLNNLNVSQNTNLINLNCSGSDDITTLDVSQNTALETLNCSELDITTLDLRQNTNLQTLNCFYNSLSALDVRNGNNTAITSFDARFNSSLTCISVDNVSYSATNWTNIDAASSFSANCNAVPVVAIPDANFKAYLVGNTAINTNGDTEIQVTEATAFTGTINCSNLNIADITGVEAFENLVQLKCNNNSLSSMDISQNIDLVVLICNNNNLSSLNVNQNSGLTQLLCHNNSISSLNVSQNPNLTRLFCSGNPIATLDLTQNVSLERLYAGSTALTTLDLTQNIDLAVLDCSSSQLNNLNIKSGSNTNITSFKTTNNPNLTCIEVDVPAYSTANWTNIDAGTSFNTNCNISALIVYIPDANFKNYLLGNTAINTNGDTEIQVTEASAFSGKINCPNMNIADLTGVEAFVNLTQLVCYNNNLTGLDVTQNTSLNFLHCVNNSLTSLDVTDNTSLSWLFCSANQLNSLDLTQNIALKKLYAASNQLGGLNIKNGNNTNITVFKVTNNPNLTCIDVDNVAYSTANWMDIDAVASFSVNCNGSALIVTIPNANFKAYLVGNTAINTNGDTEIQVSEATAFTGTINCSSLSISDLTGIEAFENLTNLDCSSNNLTDVELIQNTSLTSLNCSNNNLSNLNVRNGNNVNFSFFDARSNSSLTCISVDNVTYSTANWTNVDAGTVFNTNCNISALIVYIPDANFKAYLVGNTAINTNGDTEIQVTEASAFSGTINCPNMNIADLTGVETFVNLMQLKCQNNNLTSLDVTQNTSLNFLHCVNNSLTSLDVTENTNLSWLFCSANQLSSLDLTQNIALKKLYAASNQLGGLNIKNGNNTNITVFKVTNNPNLTCIDVDNVAYSTANWMDIDAVASFSVNCYGPAPIVTIPNANFKAYLVGNTAINTNGDTEIQVSEATAFTGTINCSSLSISDLTGIEAFENLTNLDCSFNNLTDVELIQNTSLTSLNCSNNNLSNLNVRNGNNVNFSFFDARSNSSLTCIGVDSVTYSTANWTNVDSGAAFNTNCNIPALIVYIPDANFKAYLVGNTAINTNGDTEIQLVEAINYTRTISCSNRNIVDLTGLEAFVNLTTFNCLYNPITRLDVRQNTSLTRLRCSTSSQLSYLDVRNGNNMNFLSFNTENCPNLTCISVDDVAYSTTNWTDIDTTASFNVDCNARTVTIPDANFKAYLVGNTAINTNGDAEIQLLEAVAFTGTINCSNSNTVDLTGLEEFVNLTGFVCSNNPITSLDMRQHISLITFDCSSSSLLSDVNLRNSNNANFLSFDATNCPSLSCIAVDNQTYSTTNWTNIDAGASFNVTCGAPIVNIPDVNFKAYLVGNTAINTDGDTEIQVSEAIAFTGRIDCPNQNIADLTGIEVFVNLTQLKCYRNNLTSLDISQNLNLVLLHTANNLITTLDVSQHTNLSWLSCSSTNLTSLDVTQNTNLTKLYCGAMPITSLDVTQNTNLTTLDCPNSQLTSIDVSQNTSLTVFSCSFSNSVSSVTVKNGNNTNVTYFRALDLPNLSCMEVDDTTYSSANWSQTGASIRFSLNCATLRVAQNSDISLQADLVKNTAINLNRLEVLDSPINLSVYPNPTTREITLDFGKTYEDVTILIMNVTGHILKRKTIQNSATTNLELEGGAGVYFISIQTEEGKKTLNVIKE